MFRNEKLSSLVEGLPPSYWLLWIGTLINRLGGFVMPFLTLYLTGQRGIPTSRAALMVSLLGAGSFVSQLAGGELADRIGRRPILLLSFFATPPVIVMLGYAQSIALIAILTLLAGFFTDLYRPAVSAAVADLVEPAARPRGYGYIYWAINLGAALAPVIAGLMASRSYLFLFWADAATTLAFGLIILVGYRETRPSEAGHHAAHSGVRQRAAQLGRAPVLLWFSFLTLFIGMIYAQGNVTLPLDMAAHGLGPESYGLAISINGFLIILTTIAVSNMAIKWPRFPTMAASALLLGAGFGFTAAATRLPLFALSVAIWTMGEILATSVAPTIIADLSPIELRGLFQGIFGSAWGLAFFLGPIVGGWVYENLGVQTLWLSALALGITLTLAYLMLGRLARSHLETPAEETV
jgi:MFS family permease